MTEAIMFGIGIDAAPAREGANQVKAAYGQIVTAAEQMVAGIGRAEREMTASLSRVAKGAQEAAAAIDRIGKGGGGIGSMEETMRRAEQTQRAMTQAMKSLSGEVNGLRSVVSAVNGDLSKIVATQQAWQRQTTADAAAAKEMAKAAQDMAAAAKLNEKAISGLTDAVTKNTRAMEEQASRAPKVGKGFNDHADGANRAAKATGLAAHEMTNLSYQVQDFIVQVGSGQGIFMPLLQQGPQATSAVGGVGRAISLLLSPVGLATTGAIALAGAVTLVGVRAVSIGSDLRDLTVLTKAYGTEAQASAVQLRDMAKAMYEAGAGKDESTAVAKALATTRGITASMARDFANLGNDMAAGLGQTADAVVKQLAAMATEGYPAIKKLQDQIGFLNDDEMKAVRTMSEHGQQTEALGVAMSALHRRFDGLREQSMGPTEKAFHDLGVGWNGFMDAVAQSRPVMDAIANVSAAVTRMSQAVTSTPKQQVADLEARAQEIRNSIAMRDAAKGKGETYLNFNLWNIITGTTDGADLENQLAGIEKQLKAARDRVVADLAKTPVRVAGTSGAASSTSFRPDEKAIQYVDEQTAAYDRLSKAMQGNAGQRALGMAAMQAENEIRDKNLKGQDAEDVRNLRRKEAMLMMAASYSDEMQGLTLAAQGSMKLADAYGVSEAAAITQKAANDAMAASVGNAAVNVAELTKQNVAAAAAASMADLSKQNFDLKQQAELLPTVTAATKDGVAARMEAERQMQVRLTLAPALAAADAAEAQGNKELALRLRATAEAYQLRAKVAAEQQKSDNLEKLVASQKLNIDQLKMQRSLIGASAQEQAKANALFDAERQIKALGIDTTKQLTAEDAERVKKIRDQAVEYANVTLEVQRQQDAMQTLGDACDFPDDTLDDPECMAIFTEALS